MLTRDDLVNYIQLHSKVKCRANEILEEYNKINKIEIFQYLEFKEIDALNKEIVWHDSTDIESYEPIEFRLPIEYFYTDWKSDLLKRTEEIKYIKQRAKELGLQVK